MERRERRLHAQVLPCLAVALGVAGAALPARAPAQEAGAAAAASAAAPNIHCDWKEVTLAENGVLPVRALSLERDFMSARFDEGSFRPLRACGGRVVGLVFSGAGELEARDPGPLRGHLLHNTWRNLPGTLGFDAALIIASDGAVQQLVDAAAAAAPADAPVRSGEEPWREGGLPLDLRSTFGPRLANFDPRKEDSSRPPAEVLWTPAPELGGILAEFRMRGLDWAHKAENLELRSDWLSYLFSAAGAYGHDPGAWYRRRVGSTTAETFTSLPWESEWKEQNHEWAESPLRWPWDIEDVSAQVEIAPATGMDRDLSEVAGTARLRVRAREGATAILPLVLSAGVRRTLGEQWGELRVRGARAGWVAEGASAEPELLGVPFDRVAESLYLHLNRPPQEAETVVVELRYGGPLIEPVGSTTFTPLSGSLLYPLSPKTDRHTASVSVKLPKFWDVAATGKRIEDLEEGRMHTVLSRSAEPVESCTVYVVDASTRTDAPPEGQDLPVLRIMSGPDTLPLNTKIADEVFRHLRALASVLGPFPYDELEIVERYGASGYWLPGLLAVERLDAPPDSVITSASGSGTLLGGLAAQWFGGAVGAFGPHDRWLLDGLRSEAECLALELDAKAPRCLGRLKDLRRKWADALDRTAADWRSPPIWNALAADGDFGAKNSAYRGPLVVRQLRMVMGDEAWRKLLQRLVTSYSGGQGLSTKSLLVQAQSVSGIDLRSFFYGWVYATPADPLVRIRYSFTKEADGTWSLRCSGQIESGNESPAPAMLGAVLIRVETKKDPVLGRFVLTEQPGELTIKGLRDEPKSLLADPLGFFPGRVDAKEAAP
jgi:hypothetical protein